MTREGTYGVKFLRAYLPACLHDEINSFRLFKEAKSSLQIMKYFSQRHRLHLNQKALDNSGYKHLLTFSSHISTHTSHSRRKHRKRDIIWYNSPFSTNVSTNIGCTFLKLLDMEFTKEHVLHKIFNRNTVKISYSCMPNLKQNIDGHNKSILHNKIMLPRSCNCRVKTECPLSGNCLKESVVYQATISTEDHNPPQTYVGLTENSFKTRYSNNKLILVF